MAVSTCSPHRPAKATRVSIRRKKTRTKASPVSTPHGHDQAQATAVSRERSATPTPSHMPTPQKTRTQFDWVKFQRSLKTLQFQRCELMVRKSRRGIACEIGELSSDVSKGRSEACGTEAGPDFGARGRRRGLAGFETTCQATSRHPALLVRGALEGPEGTGGLRGAAPNDVRPPSLAGGRALRRPEHPWGHKHPRPRGASQRPEIRWRTKKKVVAPRKTWGPPLMRSLV